MIPHTEAHRFLNWQTSRDKCLPWGQWFETVGAPYELVFVPEEQGWTIYKHVWESEHGYDGHWCCGATA